MKCRLEEITEEAERRIIHIARVSNPDNQENKEYAKLLKFCVAHKHWSIFEHAHLVLEIETSLAIATQLIRHRSFTFQQFSQRYSDPTHMGFEPIELRKQAEKNRQSSGELLDEEKRIPLQIDIEGCLNIIRRQYIALLDAGVAKEVARFILPQCTTTRLYMTGNIRSWIHYIELRSGDGVQLEHRQVAQAARKIFVAELPITAQALGWTKEKNNTEEEA